MVRKSSLSYVKQLQESLHQSERLFSTLFQTCPLALSITTLADGCFVEVNKSFLRLMGYQRKEIIGRTALELGMWVDPQLREKVIQRLKKRRRISETPMQFRMKSGEIRDGVTSGNIIELGGKLCISFTLRDITEQKRTETQLLESRRCLQDLSVKLMEVQELERQNLARELHDEISQLLTGLKITLETSQKVPPTEAQKRVNLALALVNEVVERTRDLAVGLRPVLLDDLGLVPALTSHFTQYTAQTDIQVIFTHSGMSGRLSSAIEIASYRIVQEALTNVARYAGVKEVSVKLQADRQQLVLEVQDQGQGFDPSAVLTAGSRSGLAGIRERVASLRGQFTIESAPRCGCRLTVRLTLTERPSGGGGRFPNDLDRTRRRSSRGARGSARLVRGGA